MREVLHHAMWAVAVLALAHAALRAASVLAPSGLVRALATVVLAVSAAVLEALVLGAVRLGADPIALLVAALATAAAATAWLPAPAVPPARELAAWWDARALRERAAAAAIAGAGLAWVAWQVRHPAIGFDSEVYHYGQVAGWIANGRPGSSLTLSYDIPYANYPMTDEVALTWGVGIARSWIPIALWNPCMFALLAAASITTLRTLAVPPGRAVLATATLLATPLVVRQLSEAQTDLPALTWVACTAALALNARTRPGLLLPALLAGGLAIGTKTTAAPEVLAALAAGAVLARRELRALAPRLVVAAVAAAGLGGLWYARNLVEHGSPLWPFARGPFGDPSPAFLGLVDRSFVQHPLETLDGHLGDYVDRLGGAWLLLPGTLLALVAAALGRRWDPALRRAVLIAAGLATLAALVWSTAWGTGVQTSPLLGSLSGWPLSAVRYLLPALALATLAVALVTRAPGIVGWGARALLVVALAWSLVLDARLGAPSTPSLRALVSGAGAGLVALGVLTAAARALRARDTRPAPWIPAAAAALAVGAFVVGSAEASDGYIRRFTEVASTTAFGREALAWHLSQPGFAEGSQPVVFASRAVLAPFAGDHFTHPLSLLPADVTCAAFDRAAARAYVVVTPQSYWAGVLGIEPYAAGRCAARRRPSYSSAPFTVFSARPAGSPAAETR